MSHVSHKLSNSLEGALAGGGDPATSPLYVFGPFLKLIVIAGVAQVTFGASLWLVVFTILVVSAMYRQVMRWVTDGSGGSGLSEEEFGSWAVKLNASITFIEYTLTFLVSMAALVTFIADRFPLLNERLWLWQYRTFLAIGLSVFTGWLVNRGPKMAARFFGPATAAVLLLLWLMVGATLWQRGLQLPDFNLNAFRPDYLAFTLGGYARILAVMTGIEIFANLVAAYDGTPGEKSSKAFGSLIIVMGTTAVTMLIVGPAIYALSDPTHPDVSVFTQAMDSLLPAPLPWLGTLIGVAVLLSASAASAQGLQNLAAGLKLRHYVPIVIGHTNRFGVAAMPVWIEIGLVAFCFLIFGAEEEIYLAIYAAGVFILLSMTGWAAAKRLLRGLQTEPSWGQWASLGGTAVAASLTTLATGIIFFERFREGAWTYFLFLPILYAIFTFFRHRLGDPTPQEERLGRLQAERRYLPGYIAAPHHSRPIQLQKILVPLDGSDLAEEALSVAQSLAGTFQAELTLMTTLAESPRHGGHAVFQQDTDPAHYLAQTAAQLAGLGLSLRTMTTQGPVITAIDQAAQEEDLIVMSTNGRSGLKRLFIGSVASGVIQLCDTPVLLLRPTGDWRSRGTSFQRLLVALDGSENAERILPYVRLLAQKYGSDVLLLTVPVGIISENYLNHLRDYLEKVANALQLVGVPARTQLTDYGGPARTIVRVCQTEMADLIMLATHGRGGFDRLMVGSVADRVIQQMPCPVFLAPIHTAG